MEFFTKATVPTWVMLLVVSILTVSLVLGVPLARSAGRRRGIRLAHPEAYETAKDKAKDTALFLAALVPSLLVWLAVMGVSFIGLTGFAADVMHWDHWTNVLVPFSLDGISVSFGAWAFVAVKRGRHPGRAYKIVLAAATVSATLNFVHGRDKWSIWAGLYLAFLSMAGMAMFHELLDQFMAGYDDELALKTRYPRFGQRWIYAPLSTFASRRAWIVYPPEEDVRPSIRNALDHLEWVRESKRQRRLNGALRVREEQQAKLVEVHARAEVRRARAAGWRGGDDTAQTSSQPSSSSQPQAQVPHQAVGSSRTNDRLRRHPAPAQHEPQPLATAIEPAPQPQPQPAPAAPAPLPPSSDGQPIRDERGTVLDPELRAILEEWRPQQGRDPMGHRPLTDTGEFSPRQLLPLVQDSTQRMIADALAMGENVTNSMIRDWVESQINTRPSEDWARKQLRAVRQRDTYGVDADLV